MFPATLWSVYREKIYAKNGADANILGKETLSRVSESGGEFKMEYLPKPRIFIMAAHDRTGAKSELKCTQVATMDTDVHIIHGTKFFKIRRLWWLVSKQDVPEPLQGRPLLEALGLYTQKILGAAADQYAGTVDAYNLDMTRIIVQVM